MTKCQWASQSESEYQDTDGRTQVDTRQPFSGSNKQTQTHITCNASILKLLKLLQALIPLAARYDGPGGRTHSYSSLICPFSLFFLSLTHMHSFLGVYSNNPLETSVQKAAMWLDMCTVSVINQIMIASAYSPQVVFSLRCVTRFWLPPIFFPLSQHVSNPLASPVWRSLPPSSLTASLSQSKSLDIQINNSHMNINKMADWIYKQSWGHLCQWCLNSSCLIPFIAINQNKSVKGFQAI